MRNVSTINFSGIHHLALNVRDLDASVRWYSDVLGFSLLFSWDTDSFDRRLMSHRSGVVIGLTRHKHPDAGEEFNERRTGLDHVAFAVETHADLEAWAARLTDAGVPFGISASHAESLWRQWSGQESGRVVTGALPPPEEMPNYRTREYEILMLHEHHWLGPDGLPTRHRTQINICSRIDGLYFYQYRFDTDRARVRARRSQGAEIGPVYEVSKDIFAVDFALDRPLGFGEDEYLEFWTFFDYKERPPLEMRRGTHELINDLYMRVEFHRQKLPSDVWWGEWLDYRGDNDRIIKAEPHTLDERLIVHLRSIERAVVGFTWKWPNESTIDLSPTKPRALQQLAG